MSIERKPGLRRLALACGIGLGSFWLAACPGSLENPEDFETSGVCDAPRTILASRCATSNCHDAEDPVSSLDLTDDAGLAERLVDVAGVDCGGALAAPADPTSSLLYTKCLDAPACGSRMPQVGAALTEDELACLAEWIGSLAD